MTVSAVIAAAGLSSRMHDFKPLMVLDGDTIISRIVRTMRGAGVKEIVVVAGYRGEELERHLQPLDVQVVLNRSYAETQMLHSIKMGIASLQNPCDLLFLLPGDVPLIQTDTLLAMMVQRGQAVRPVCGGKTGHPLMVRSELIPMLLDYKGPGGLNGALTSMELEITDLSVDDRGCTLDADTHEDILEIHRQYALDRGRDSFWPELQICIGRGGYLFTPKDAQFLELIEYTGSIRRACSCLHMSYTKGWSRLRKMEQELNMGLTHRNPGGSCGGSTTLTSKGKTLLLAYRSYAGRMIKSSREIFEQEFKCLDETMGEY